MKGPRSSYLGIGRAWQAHERARRLLREPGTTWARWEHRQRRSQRLYALALEREINAHLRLDELERAEERLGWELQRLERRLQRLALGVA